MTEENKTYIRQLKVADVPWHRLTTAYGRGTDFPAHLIVLEQMRDLASVKKSLYVFTTNLEHQGTLWHATPFGTVFPNAEQTIISTNLYYFLAVLSFSQLLSAALYPACFR